MSFLKLKPKADSLASGSYSVIYSCAKCQGQFRLADPHSWHFCPYCGVRLDWGVIVTVNEEFRKKFSEVMYNKEEKAKLMFQIDELNMWIKSDTPSEMIKTEATKKAILSSNIDYYIKQGWTKEELISQGFFTEEDFDLIKDN